MSRNRSHNPHLSEVDRPRTQRYLSRRRFLLGAGALGLGTVAGCGTQSAAPDPTVQPTTAAPTTALPATAAPTTALAPAAPTGLPVTATVPAASTAGATAEAIAAATIVQAAGFPPFASAPSMLEIVEDRSETVVVRHRMGDVEIPKNPQRVFADAAALHIALLLDLNIVSADVYPESDYLPNHKELVAGIPDLVESGSDALNYERVVAANPDLILAPGHVYATASGNPDEAYARLSQIAPTIIFNDDAFTYWREASLELGRALGIENDVAAKLANFDRDVIAACEPLQRAIGNESVIRATLFGASLWVQSVGQRNQAGEGFIPAADTRWLYESCQLYPPAFLNELLPEGELWVEITGELIPELTADHIFMALENEEAQQGYDVLAANPLWQRLPAVKAGNVYITPRTSAISYEHTLFTITNAAEALTEAR